MASPLIIDPNYTVSANQGPTVVENYLKKLKNVGAVMRFLSKFTKRWFILNLRSGKFYYTKNKNTAKAKESYNVNVSCS